MKTLLFLAASLVIAFSSCRNEKNAILGGGIVPHDHSLTYIETEKDWVVLAPVDINNDGNPEIKVDVTGMALSRFLFLRAAHPEEDIFLDLIDLRSDGSYVCGAGAVYLKKQE